MATTTELHGLVGDLQRCVHALAAQYGDSAAMRRVANDADCLSTDVNRLDIDDDELTAGQKRPDPAPEKITIADTAYDPTFWRDVDEEGLGGAH
ncbi:hypothetical protein [Mycolicibacterium fortuitum]|uniref:hypothetical protein n=1 Tax=Mycolicibacterium fortuitum TaxID=1766 RepID=UPI0026333CF0|nr:hypothetical protein [Mycolicibacterium fortuitum]